MLGWLRKLLLNDPKFHQDFVSHYSRAERGRQQQISRHQTLKTAQPQGNTINTLGHLMFQNISLSMQK